MIKFCLFLIAFAGLGLSLQAENVELPDPLAEFSASRLDWRLNAYSKVSGNILTVTVPEANAAAQNVTIAKIDLKPYRGQRLYFSIKVRSIGVSTPAKSWNGIKFMLNYRPAGGTDRWHHPNGLFGDFDWKEVSFLCGVDQQAESGTLMLGLQDCYGKAEFDLNTLKVYHTDQTFNADHQAVYSESVSKRPFGRGVMSPHTCTEDDFKTLKAWNVNLMRMQITRQWGEAGTDQDLVEYDKWLDGKLDHLEQALKWAGQYGIKLVIDLHSPPGGRDKSMDMNMFYQKKFADHFIKVWQRIATRFKGNSSVWGYDLVNEPTQTRPARYDYWALQKAAAEAVRAIDPVTPIIIESNEWDGPNAFSYLSPLVMDNVIYQVHMYMPGGFTHQGVHNTAGVAGGNKLVTYPGEIDGTYWNIDELRKALKPVRDFQLKHNARIYVGEFSAIAWAPGADKYLADCITIFEEYRWDWTYHAFREWSGWSVEHEGQNKTQLVPASDTLRKKALLKGLKGEK